MNQQFHRTELLLGKTNIKLLQESRVAVIGLGGVGSYVAESLARAGICDMILIDFDKVNITNINRQLIALHSTIGENKTEVMRKRLTDINPEIKLHCISEFFSQENRLEYLKQADYIIDAIDSIGPKMGMIKDLIQLGIPHISVLGAGNRIDPSHIHLTSIWKTHQCPLAKRLKKLLRRYGVTSDFPVVYSDEVPIEVEQPEKIEKNIIRSDSLPKSLVGSISYMPAIMGLIASSWIIRTISQKEIIYY